MTHPGAPLEAAIAQMADGVVVRDLRGRVTYANRAAQQLLGDLARPGTTLREFLDQLRARHPDGQPVAPDDVPEVRARSGETVEEWEFLVQTPRGERQLALAVAPIAADDGRILGTVSVLRDVTEPRLVEKAKDRFLTVASHELKTPLAPLRIYLQYLQRQIERGALQTDELNYALVKMDQQVERLAILIDDLLDISRLREGRLTLRREPTDLGELVVRVVARFESEAELSEAPAPEIVLEAPDRAPIGNWDPNRLEQVLTNLLSNALKYSPSGGPVTVRVERTDGHARVSVIDVGIGVHADDLEQLFQPFYRGRNASALDAGGLGLGLSISKGIVEAHGGRIWVESREGQGSTFAFELPLEGQGDS